MTAEEICSRRKKKAIVVAKEAMIVVGQELGASNGALARLIGVDSSVVSRRFESGKTRMNDSQEMRKLVEEVRKLISKTKPEN